MKIIQLCLGVILACIISWVPVEAGIMDSIKNFFWRQETPPPAIKVLIMHDQPKALIEVQGKYKVYDPHNMNHLTTRPIAKKQNIEPLHSGLRWGEEFPGIHQLLIVPDEQGTQTMVNGKFYSGSLYVYDIGGTISIVNELPLEEYLMAVLTPSYNQELPAEALAAIAIAARTQAYYASLNLKNNFWAVDARKVGFEGINAIRPGAVAQAIATTRNMVLSKTGIYEGITPFPAQWSVAGAKPQSKDAVVSRITLFDVESRAKKGEHAAQILAQAFPQSMVVLIQP